MGIGCGVFSITSEYPFTQSGLRSIEGADIYVGDIVAKYRSAIDAAVDALVELLRKGEEANVSMSLIQRYVAYMIASTLDRKYWRRIADAESKIFARRISNSLKVNYSLDCVKALGIEVGLNVVGLGEVMSAVSKAFGVGRPLTFPIRQYSYAVKLWDYLRYAPKNDPNWMLGTRPIVRGYVLLTTHDLFRLIEEAAEAKIMDIFARLNEKLDILKPLIDAASGRLKDIQESVPQPRPVKVRVRGVEGDPPCITSILNELRGGGNPSHMARFTLAAYLGHKCVDVEGKSPEECVDEVLEPFTHAADYNEKIARYQVEHILGLRGGRKFYTPPSCQELNSLGLCPTNLGCGVKNPLQYLKPRFKAT